MTELAGDSHAGFRAVGEVLRRHVDERGRGGGAVAVYHRGEPVVDVWCGERDAEGTPWSADTVVMSQSTTKGVTSTALHLCAERGLVDYDAPVATYWPEFAAAGKAGITVRHLLCHEAGLFPVAPLVDDAMQLNDWDRMVDALAAATPVHPPGVANGYHAFTFGWLVGEVVRRVTGRSLGTVVAEELAGPLGCDGLFIGLPTSEDGRRATLLPGEGADRASLGERLAQLGARASDATGSRGSGGDADPGAAAELTWSADHVRSALDPPGVDRWLRSPETPRAEVPAANGCFTARSLARLYAVWAAGGSLDGVRLFGPERVEAASTVQNTRPDLVLHLPIHWRLGFHTAFTTAGVVRTGFGHNGFGGSGAWGDPSRQLSVAYTLNGLSGGSALGDLRFAEVGAAAVAAADDRP